MYEELLQNAAEVRRNACCLYSHFAVGAALLCNDGTVYTGCNVENAAYPLCLCAERNAFGSAVADGKKKGDFKAIAIVGGNENETAASPCFPCGACRQVMAQFCGEDFEVVLTDGTYPLGELLPYSFSL
ncbi:MAG: cytidine deaminase [Oscillospiraceae bacterium]|nr:cytidine deaminase [Oscillospiraceae bacterium]